MSESGRSSPRRRRAISRRLRDPVVLFERVAEHRSILINPASADDLDEPAKIRVPVDLDELIVELADLASSGRAVLDMAERARPRVVTTRLNGE